MPIDALTAVLRNAAIEEIGDLLRQWYVVPGLVPAIVKRLDRAARSGRYDTADPAEFAGLIDADMREASADKHLYLRFDPVANARLKQRDATQTGPDEATCDQARRIHYGFAEQRLLDGNVRYLRITDFDWVPGETEPAIDAAVRFLRDADAIVIDLRGNLGGEPKAVQYLVSHFLAPDVPLISFVEAAGAVRNSTLADLPSGRLLGTPLFVLIDHHTYSAGEAFAYHARHFGFGELVGVSTAGAARVNTRLPVGSDFVISVSYGEPEHPVTGTSWEGVGVLPTIEAPAEEALEVAHGVALQRLAAGAVDEKRRAEYVWASVAVKARRTPPPQPDPATAADLVGRYGPAEITLRGGRLWLLRPGRHDFCLTPLTAGGLYGAVGNNRLRVRLGDGRMVIYPGFAGEPMEYRRVNR